MGLQLFTQRGDPPDANNAKSIIVRLFLNFPLFILSKSESVICDH